MTAPHAKRLLGEVVVVGGAAPGQGAAEAEALVREDARVVATDVTGPRLPAPERDQRRASETPVQT
ncbi:hypothetical protein ACFY8K_30755 [Streptomyces misionensis]|uniref:hypothetical protein n=1 Tax=Streptomyces misionensis TaxID=67331 RepID=UPI0036B9DC3D